MIESEENEKIYTLFKVITIIVIGFFVGVCFIFFIGVNKVNALEFGEPIYIGQYNTSGNLVADVNGYNLTTNTSSNLRSEIDLPYSNFWNTQTYSFELHYSVTYVQSSSATGLINLSKPKLYWYTIKNNQIATTTEITSGCNTTYTQSVNTIYTQRIKVFNFTSICTYINPTNTQNGIQIRIPFATNITDIIKIQTKFESYSNFRNVPKDQVSDNDKILGGLESQTDQINQNNNSNTDKIIENNNSNTDRVVDSINNQNKKCENYSYNNKPLGTKGKILLIDGSEAINSSYYISKYIKVEKNKTYTITKNGNNWGSNASYCLYDKTKAKLSCNEYEANTNITITPQVDGYIRYSIRPNTNNGIIFTGENCYNLIEKQNETNEEIKDSLNDSSIDDPSTSFNGMENYFGSNGVISDLLLLPVRMYQNIVNTIDGTCSDFSLGSLLGHNLTMPCIDISSKLGSTLYGVIDVLISGFFILSIRKKFVDIFEHFTSLKTGGNELE